MTNSHYLFTAESNQNLTAIILCRGATLVKELGMKLFWGVILGNFATGKLSNKQLQSLIHRSTEWLLQDSAVLSKAWLWIEFLCAEFMSTLHVSSFCNIPRIWSSDGRSKNHNRPSPNIQTHLHLLVKSGKPYVFSHNINQNKWQWTHKIKGQESIHRQGGKK